MSTSLSGAAGELLVAFDLMKHGCHVYKDMDPSSATDLLINHGERYLKIQVKSIEDSSNGVVGLQLFKVKRHKDGSTSREFYIDRGVDVMALAVLDRREVLYFDRRILSDDRVTITARYIPPKNAQVKGVSYASDFSFEKTFGV